MAFGGFRQGSEATPMAEINMIPLIDVMLVLLVIFIITAPLMASSIKLDLPRTDAGQPGDTPKFVSLSVDTAGRLFLNDQPVTAEELAARLQRAAADNRDTEVQLRADQAVPYGRIVELMGIANKAGLSHIGFVTDAPLRKP
jgi:biopolymer transport protein TolR